MSLKKLTNITGLNESHPLFSAISRFLNFDAVITCLKNGTVYTSTSAFVEDSGIGYSREFQANANALTPTVPVLINNTVLMIYRHIEYGATTAGDAFMFQRTGGNIFALRAGNYSTYEYQLQLRGSFGTQHNANYKPYNLVEAQKLLPHAATADYASGGTSFWQNGARVPLFAGNEAGTFTPNESPLPVTIAPVVGTGAAFRLAGFVVFNRILTDEEKASVTTDPWAMTNGTLPLAVSLSGTLTPGGTITATLTNYPSLPTTVTIADSRGNDIVLPLTATGANTVTFTVPSLASSNAGQEYVQFGAVNLTFGGKTITGTFSAAAPKTYVTLAAPVATTAFEAWGSDVPVANEQLTSESNFDVNGNFTGADQDATYTCWITRLDGTNHRFTVRQGSAGPGPDPEPSEGRTIRPMVRDMIRDMVKGMI